MSAPARKLRVTAHLAATLALAAAGLAACDKAAITGDSSMRIAVDVYKGPLSEDPEIQWAHLYGYIQEANTSLDHFIHLAMMELRQRTGGAFPRLEEGEPAQACVLRDWRTLYSQLPSPTSIPTDILLQQQKVAIARKNAKEAKQQRDTAWPGLGPYIGRSLQDTFGFFQQGDRTLGSRAVDYDDKQKAYEKAEAEAEREEAILREIEARPKITLNSLPDSDVLLRLLSDACEAWVITDNTHVNARVWTDRYHQFLGMADKALGFVPDGGATGGRAKNSGTAESQKGSSASPGGAATSSTNQSSGTPSVYDFNAKLSAVMNAERGDSAAGLSEVQEQGLELRRDLTAVLTQLSSVGARLKAKAGFWAHDQAILMSTDLKTRQIVAAFQLIAAEYSNRIVASSDALQKQTYLAERREMPISSLLRDAGPTGFANMLVFNNATNGPLSHEALFSEWQQDRVRVIERLYNDDSWSNINQAYASGRGEVRMAFVKDEIGNWNLKNFDSDPSEVLQAYKKVGQAALKAAVDVASSASGVGAAQTLIGLANQMTLGSGGGAGMTPQEQQYIALMRQTVIAQLKQLKTDTEKKAADLKTQLATDTQAAKDAKDALTKAQGAVNDYVGNNPPVLNLPVEVLRANAVVKEQEAGTSTDATARTQALDLANKWRGLAALVDARDKAAKDLDTATAKQAKTDQTLKALPAAAQTQAQNVLKSHGAMLDVLSAAAAGSAPPPSLPSRVSVPQVPTLPGTGLTGLLPTAP
jgi:hypothetical protein